MGDLSEHFSRAEFACKCGCMQDTVDAELITVLERIRVHFNRPVMISSGNRCESYNARIKGAPNSQHKRSRAADIVVGGVHPLAVYEWLDAWHGGGLGGYATFTHVDSRGTRARWKG